MLMISYNKSVKNELTKDIYKSILDKYFDIILIKDFNKQSHSHNSQVYSFLYNKTCYFIKIIDLRFPFYRLYSEIEGMLIAKKIGISVPEIFCYGVFENNNIQYPYIVTKKIKGEALICKAELQLSDFKNVFNIIESLHSVKSLSFGSITNKDISFITYSNYFEFIDDAFQYALKKQIFLKHKVLTSNLIDLHSNYGLRIFNENDSYVLSHKDINAKNVFYYNGDISIIDWEWSLYLDNETDYSIFLISILTDMKNEIIFYKCVDYLLTNNICNKNRLFFHLAREIIFSIAFSKRDVIIEDRVILEKMNVSLEFFKKINYE
jgi:hypothetical protein